MKKACKTALFLCIFSVFAVITAGLPLSAKAISAADLGVANPGVLPSNPFYFFKKWKRDIKRVFTFNSAEQSRLELEILNERAAEISRLAKIFPNGSAVINSSVDQYLYNLSILPVEKETVSFAVVRFFKHWQLFEELMFDKASDALVAKIKQMFKDGLAEPLEVRKLVKEQFLSDQQLFKGLRMAEAVDAAGIIDLEKLKEDLLIDFVAEIKSNGSETAVLSLGGDLIFRIKAFDAVRFQITDANLKSRLNVLRQAVIKSAEEKNVVNNLLIELLMAEVDSRFDALNKLAIQGKPPLILKLIGQAEFYRSQMAQSYNDRQFYAALGQATNALAAVKTALFFLSVGGGYYPEEIELLKFDYDYLDGQDGELEREIINVSDIVNNAKIGRPEEKIENLIFNVKLLLAEKRYKGNN